MVEDAPKRRRYRWLLQIPFHLLASGIGLSLVWRYISPFLPDIPNPFPDITLPDHELQGTFFAVTIIFFVLLFLRAPGLRVFGTIAFGLAAASVVLPWVTIDGQPAWEDETTRQGYEWVFVCAAAGALVLVLGRSTTAAASCAFAAVAIVAVGLYNLADLPREYSSFSGRHGTMEVALGLYVTIGAGTAALAVSLIWAAILWLKRPPPPLTFPTIREQFPHL
jgi:hypothetical protein